MNLFPLVNKVHLAPKLGSTSARAYRYVLVQFTLQSGLSLRSCPIYTSPGLSPTFLFNLHPTQAFPTLLSNVHPNPGLPLRSCPVYTQPGPTATFLSNL